jgi:nucleoside transporter
MFLQYALWGSWVPVAQTYFMGAKPVGVGLTSTQLGTLFAIMPIASLLMAPLFGNLADRYFNAEKLLAVLHLLAAVALFGLAKQTTFAGVLVFLILHCLAFAPTVALSNTVVLANLPDPAKQFSRIRLMGTFGWLCSGIFLSIWRSKFSWSPVGDLFIQAGVIGVVLGLICFLLPKTPPKRDIADKYSFGKAFGLMKERNFMVFMLFAFVVSATFDFYYLCASGFLTAPPADVINKSLPEMYQGLAGSGLGISTQQVSSIMTLAQLSEIVFMFVLPWLMRTCGIRWTVTIGFFAMFLRFAVFAFLPTKGAVLPAMMLHGPCFACIFVAGAIYVEQTAPSEIRASAQGLFNMATFGIGRVIGSLFAGHVQALNTTELPRVVIPGGNDISSAVQWQVVFAIPAGLTLACVLLFPILFNPKKSERSTNTVSS